MKKHIELERRFYRLDEDADAFPEDATHYGESEYITEGWEKLLTRKRVVVLAEGGTGKSEELKAQARKLAEAGKPAFYARIERLADVDIDRALERGNACEIAAWRDGDGDAYFFLDSVDEARLTNRRFRDALKTIADAIRGAEERAHIFISSRPSDWRWGEDVGTVKELLPVQGPGAARNSSGEVAVSDEALLIPFRERQRRQNRRGDDDDKEDAVTVVVLLGLSRSKIEKLGSVYLT